MGRRRFSTAGTLVLALSVVLRACGEGGTAPALTLSVVAGGNQSAEAGATLAPIVVQVSDVSSGARAGVHLHAQPTAAGSVTPIDVMTDASGEATFVWTLGQTLGSQELRIEDSESQRFVAIAVVARQPAVASIAIDPGSATLSPGETRPFTATLRDAHGGALAGRSVAWSSSNAAVASVNAGTGVVTAVAPGSATIRASSDTVSATANVVVTGSAASAAQLAITTQPAGAADGVAFTAQPVVELRDASGQPTPGVSAAVTAAIQSGTGTLSGTTTVSTVNGVARFTDLRISGSGTFALQFTAPGLTAATTATFAVTSLSVVTASLPAATQGVQYSQQLVASGGTGSYAWALASGSLPAGLSVSATGLVSGIPGAAGTSQFTVQVTSAGATATRALSLTVGGAGAVATQLGVVTQPGGAVTATAFTVQPTIAVRDASGAVVAGSSAVVTAAISSGTGTLSGTTAVAAINGVAAFNNLRITGTGAHTLVFSSPGLANATSASFAVAPAPSGVVLDVGFATPASVQAGQNISIPIVLDMTNAASVNVASIQFSVSWDATKFDFVSGTENGASGFTFVANTGNAAAGGMLAVAGVTAIGTTATTTLYTVVLAARASAANTSTVVTAAVGGANDQTSVPVSVTPRSLTVTITP